MRHRNRLLSLLLALTMVLSLLPAFAAELEPEEIAPAEQGEELTEEATEAPLEEEAPPEAPEEETTEAPAGEPAAETPEEEEAVTEAPMGDLGGVCGNGVYWNLDTTGSDAGTLKIYGNGAMNNYGSAVPDYDSDDDDYHSADAPWYDYRNQIKTIDVDDDVTSIGKNAFRNCDNVTEVTISSDVTSIGNRAFSDCTSLTELTIIGNHLTSIGDEAFSNCKGLTSIVIPGSVTSIGAAAFYNCMGLTSATLGDGLTVIGDSMFSSCNALVSVTIPDSVTSIGAEAFNCCGGLTSVTIPGSVTSIGKGAFNGCDRLASVTVPGSVTSIGKGVFSWCDSLTSVTLGEGLTVIGDSMFYNCDSLVSVTIPASVTTIRDSAFQACDSLSSITIPNGVTSIGKMVFYYCDKLTSVAIPDSLRTIGEQAFYGCESLTSFTIPVGVETIHGFAFCGCTQLGSVTIPPKVASIGEKAFGYYLADDGAYVLMSGFTIYGNSNSAAERYAADNKITFVSLNSLAKATVTAAAQTYTGKMLTPAPTVKLNGITLTQGTDYTAAYSNNVNAGTATITVTGKGNYTGTASGTFTINKASLAKAKVTAAAQTWTGKARTPAPKVVLGGKTLKKGTDYTVTYKNNVKPGKATVTITGKGNYAGTASGTFTVKKLAKPVVKSIQVVSGGVKLTLTRPKGAKTLRILCKVGSGKWKKVTDTTATSVTIKQFNGKALQSGKTYAFTVQCVSGKGGYAVSDYYTKGKSILYLTAPTLSAPKSKKSGQASLRWKKIPGAGSYQLQYSTSKTFQSGVGTVTVKGLTQTLTKLPGGKVVYFRVRAVKGKNRSAWSAVESVSIKK